MRVVRAMRFGGPDVLEPGEAPDPVPGPDEVVVDVAVAEVLFLDTQLRAGWGREFFRIEPPFVPGAGVAGTVGAGPDGRGGRRVVAGLSGAGDYRGGGYAERAVTTADALHDVPDGVGLSDALAALHDGLMAVSRLAAARPGPGDVVLVTAAAGSIGAWLVPLAVRAGATVVAAARGERKAAVVRGLGAHLAVDPTRPGWTDAVRDHLGGRAVDVVFDGTGGTTGAEAFALTARGSRFFSYGAAAGGFPDIGVEARQRGVRVVGIDDQPTPADRRRHVSTALDHVATGRIHPLIGQAVPLERAAEAHAAMAERTVAGKTLLLTGGAA